MNKILTEWLQRQFFQAYAVLPVTKEKGCSLGGVGSKVAAPLCGLKQFRILIRSVLKNTQTIKFYWTINSNIDRV